MRKKESLMAPAQAVQDPASSPVPQRTGAFPIFLSIVIVDRDPEDDLFRTMLADTIATVQPMVTDFEVIIVDNGSTSDAGSIYSKLTAIDGLPNIQVYHLLQNVDAETAYWAGIENSLGDYVLAFDPYNENLSCLRAAIELALGGKDVVLISNRTHEPSGPVERGASKLFRALFRWVYGVELKEEGAQHRLISRTVINFLLQMPRPAQHYRALPPAAGFRKETLFYEAKRRFKGDQSFGVRTRRALNMIFSSTVTPLRFASLLALFGSVLNLCYSVYVVIISLSLSNVAKGWTTLSLQQSGMFFLLSLVLLVVTEYVIRIVQTSAGGAPYFIVREATSSTLTRLERLNVESAQTPHP